ncbi:hypothetical protein SK128_025597, partial [Halocaridina rubra]
MLNFPKHCFNPSLLPGSQGLHLSLDYCLFQEYNQSSCFYSKICFPSICTFSFCHSASCLSDFFQATKCNNFRTEFASCRSRRCLRSSASEGTKDDDLEPYSLVSEFYPGPSQTQHLESEEESEDDLAETLDDQNVDHEDIEDDVEALGAVGPHSGAPARGYIQESGDPSVDPESILK